MKTLPSQLPTLLRRAATADRAGRHGIFALVRFLAVLAALVAVYSVVFHWLMAREGQDFSWVTGIYWTLTVMSTLGFGDITFHTDIGRAFSMVVLFTGVILLLIVLPFAFIRSFYAPWLEAQ
ncbi:MAG: two pore domain potassium channel family protein, partial [Myxococcales bacterium]|nr:two pore domain potassium channel family protein [Myxococcales bacterium]